MNRALYKNAFKNITVSDDVVSDLISKAGQMVSSGHDLHRRLLKPVVVAVALVAASAITVVAAPALGVGEIFSGFFKQSFNSGLTNEQTKIVEKYGSAINRSFAADGVSLSVEGVIGDSSRMYLKYSIAADAGCDDTTYNDIMSSKLYIGDIRKGVHPQGVAKTFEQDKNDPNKFNYAAILDFEENALVSAEEVTMVIKSTVRYQDVGVNIGEIYEKYGIKNRKIEDVYDIPDSHLGIPLQYKYGKPLLESIGFADGKMILAVDFTDCYDKNPGLYLRDKETNKIYRRCDGYDEVKRGNLSIISFNVDTPEMLNQIEIVMAEEYHFSFPITSKDNTKTVDFSAKPIVSHTGIQVNSIKLSPLSLIINGSAAAGSTPDMSAGSYCVKLKDGTTLDTTKYKTSSFFDENGSFRSHISFAAPVEVENINEVVIVLPGDGLPVTIPVNSIK